MSDGKQMLYVVGAPEQVLERVTTVATEGGVLGLKTKGFKEMIQKKDTLTSEGYRVVSCAYRVFPEDEVVETDAMLSSLTLTGFIVLADPVRSTVSEAFLKTQRAGIRTIIITGDHASTALAVAQKIGFTISSNQIMEGSQIEKLTDEELGVSVRTVALFARVSPRHKLRIVTALQKNGEVVAMFGDGVNDAPALKASDIGVAVDTKVDAAREVADIVLLDGGFGTIVSAIEQGRIIFNNIRKVFLYLIVQDFSQFFLFIVSIILGLPLPLIAGQLLLVNLVESGLPDLALTTEQEKEGVMDEPPRNPKESILNKISRRWMSTIFLVSGGIAMLFYAVTFSLTGDIEKTRTVLMVFLCLESLFLVFSVRSFTKGILRKDIFSNRILVWAVGISACMILCAVYIPGAQTVLQTVPLSGTEWLIILGLNIVEITLIDFFKIKIFRKKKKVEHVHYEPAYEQ
jgi:Ca2+-transporting ATPase